MTQLMGETPDISINSLRFDGDIIEVTYQETRDIGEKAMMVRTIMARRDVVEELANEAENTIQEIVDVALQTILRENKG